MASKITSAELPLKTAINPQSVAAAGNATSGWMNAGECSNILTVVNLGALGGGTVTLTFEQAQDSSGTGAKALSAFTGGESAVNDADIVVDNDPSKLDINGGFNHVRAKLANAGGTGALVSATMHAASPRYAS